MREPVVARSLRSKEPPQPFQIVAKKLRFLGKKEFEFRILNFKFLANGEGSKILSLDEFVFFSRRIGTVRNDDRFA